MKGENRRVPFLSTDVPCLVSANKGHKVSSTSFGFLFLDGVTCSRDERARSVVSPFFVFLP